MIEICRCGHSFEDHYSEWGHLTCMECDGTTIECCEQQEIVYCPRCDTPAGEQLGCEEHI